MMLGIHVAIALSSIVFAAYTFFLPSKTKVHASQALVALTLISGTYLVVSMKANMLRTCLIGLIYTVIISFAIAAASAKLAKESPNV